ncbi:hypothetical protein CMU84_17690 [Elizabethkingia anophelis]|nr:hypothetical protein [Elizabethkingia anophelis]MDV3636981.1 hypothetical protein [Elizabethkingia anophelis]MDV3710148.1 hypothetical protein [Elizabethkingia anophelis]MDV3733635.1 hypothetical protein [Elizabethkingia anophelis]
MARAIILIINKNIYMKLNIYFFLTLLLFSCKNSDNASIEDAIQVVTKEVRMDEEGFLILGGQAKGEAANKALPAGVVWSTLTSVSKDNYEGREGGGNTPIGDFEYKSKSSFTPNTTYYFRAFVETSKGVVYGNLITYKTGNIIETLDPIDISTVDATLIGKSNSPAGSTSYSGFAYGKNPNPTVDDNSTTQVFTFGMQTFRVSLSGLTRNTEYYIRAFTRIGNKYYYGDEKKIKTAGYFGPAGGIVAYDKGVKTDGWRYLEISIKDVGRNYASTGFYRFGAVWSDKNTYLAGTSEKMGDGLKNTNFIISRVPGESAAKFCANHSANGYSDWFLPSKDEAVAIITSLYKGGMSLNSGLETWTSSEISSTLAYFVYATGNKAVSSPKYGDDITYPVRRY